jgi:hypothetical protein
MLLVLAVSLLVLAGVLSVAVIGKLPDSRGDFFPLSIVLTFTLFFAVMTWRGFASIKRTGPALSVRGWRLMAAAFVLVAAVGTIGHWAGAVLPLIVAILCLYNDPAVARILQWIGLSSSV